MSKATTYAYSGKMYGHGIPGTVTPFCGVIESSESPCKIWDEVLRINREAADDADVIIEHFTKIS